MAAYVVFVRNEITDPGEMKQYQAKAPLAREGRTLKPLAFYGAVETLEGPTVDGAVILEFPTVADAKPSYESPLSGSPPAPAEGSRVPRVHRRGHCSLKGRTSPDTNGIARCTTCIHSHTAQRATGGGDDVSVIQKNSWKTSLSM